MAAGGRGVVGGGRGPGEARVHPPDDQFYGPPLENFGPYVLKKKQFFLHTSLTLHMYADNVMI